MVSVGFLREGFRDPAPVDVVVPSVWEVVRCFIVCSPPSTWVEYLEFREQCFL